MLPIDAPITFCFAACAASPHGARGAVLVDWANCTVCCALLVAPLASVTVRVTCAGSRTNDGNGSCVPSPAPADADVAPPSPAKIPAASDCCAAVIARSQLNCAWAFAASIFAIAVWTAAALPAIWFA